jgi:hypothetical protein
MNHDQIQQILDLFIQREYELKIEQRALEIWLGVLEPFGAISRVCGIVFPLIAGFTLFGEPGYFAKNWKIMSGFLALMASILTGIHTGLKCDDHQAQCRQLIKSFKSLIEGYQAARIADESELKTRFNKLEARLKELRDSSDIRPARWCTRRAKQELKVAHQVG